MNLGEKIRKLRKAKDMKLIDLAEKAGVQIATLSRIENDKMTGTLESHMALARVLGIDVTQLYAGLSGTRKTPPSQAQIDKPASDIFLHSDKASYEILSSQMFSKKMMPVLLTIEPGGHTNKEENKPGTEKFVYVVEGNIELTVSEQTYPLPAGGSIYFDASSPHFFSNKGEQTAKAVCVATPVAL